MAESILTLLFECEIQKGLDRAGVTCTEIVCRLLSTAYPVAVSHCPLGTAGTAIYAHEGLFRCRRHPCLLPVQTSLLREGKLYQPRSLVDIAVVENSLYGRTARCSS